MGLCATSITTLLKIKEQIMFFNCPKCPVQCSSPCSHSSDPPLLPCSKSGWVAAQPISFLLLLSLSLSHPISQTHNTNFLLLSLPLRITCLSVLLHCSNIPHSYSVSPMQYPMTTSALFENLPSYASLTLQWPGFKTKQNKTNLCKILHFFLLCLVSRTGASNYWLFCLCSRPIFN